MLKPIPPERATWIAEKVRTMSQEEKIGQVMGLHLAERTDEQVREMIESCRPGSVLAGPLGRERTATIKRIFEDYAAGHEIPILVAGDCEMGAGVGGASTPFPWPMAVGACDDEELAYTMGLATGREARSHGMHWNFAPVVDLHLNFHSPMAFCRSYGEEPHHVARLARAFIRGCQQDGCMACTAKHFPGDGVDMRDPHVITSINTLSRREWMRTFGTVYREVIEEGVMAIMTGHIALPAVDEGDGGYLGPPPATMSRTLQVDLLRGELGFDGVVVSDAIDMIGYASRAPKPQRAARTIAAGADVALRAEPRDLEWIRDAVDRGEIAQERLDDAVRRVLELKARVGLLDGGAVPAVTEEEKQRFAEASSAICDGAVTIVRDSGGLLPLALEQGARVLTMDLQFGGRQRGPTQGLAEIPKALEERGLRVDHRVSPLHGDFDIYPIIGDYEAIFVNFHIPPRYGSVKMHSEIIDALWNAWWMDHGRVVFTSFANPYILWELPWMPNYLNTFSNRPASQRAAVRVWLGELPARGKSPVSLEGFFEREV